MSATPRVGASCSNQAALGSMSGVWRRMKEEGLMAGKPEGVWKVPCPAPGKPALCTMAQHTQQLQRVAGQRGRCLQPSAACEQPASGMLLLPG